MVHGIGYGGIYDGPVRACIVSAIGTTPITLKGAEDMYRCCCQVPKPLDQKGVRREPSER
eukprot:4978009-Amphidinium_carterae.1